MSAVLSIAVVAAEADVSISTVRKATGKWRTGTDDGNFPPPLRHKKGPRGYVVLRPDFDAWLESWPDPD